MLRPFSTIKHLSLGATDGEIGTIKDAYFDDALWVLRYLVVSTGSWLSGRDVLIAPASIVESDWTDNRFEVNLTRERIENAPGIETDKPVSRQREAEYLDYYGYPYYWAAPQWGGLGDTGALAAAAADMQRATAAADQRRKEPGDPHLRSASEVGRYAIEAADGSIGHVEDFLFDDAQWSLRYFVVDTRKWMPGRKVLISTEWIDTVSWESRQVRVAMTREEVRTSPEYDPQRITQEQEGELHRHYGRKPGATARIQIR